MRTGLAPAKINLCLHVGPARIDGYHPLASLVTFADVGDRITVAPADRLSLRVTGPLAAGLEGEADNLILRALRALGQVTGTGDPAVDIELDKQLPIASGLGGGSSDAATALKLTNDLLDLGLDEVALAAVAAVVGADGPMCVTARTAWAEGIGDRLEPIADWPTLFAVLVNPRRPSPTGAVYAALDRDGAGTADRPDLPPELSARTVVNWLADQRNDLERPAVALDPVIRQVIDAVAASEGNRLSRLSGSGATVFGLYDDRQTVDRAVSRLSSENEGWWIRPCLLGV